MADETRGVPDWAVSLMQSVAELKGATNANMASMNSELSRLNSELIRQAAESERKHLENLQRSSKAIDEIGQTKERISEKIDTVERAIQQRLEDHKKEDDERFLSMGDTVKKITYGFAGVSFIALIFWAVISQILK